MVMTIPKNIEIVVIISPVHTQRTLRCVLVENLKHEYFAYFFVSSANNVERFVTYSTPFFATGEV